MLHWLTTIHVFININYVFFVIDNWFRSFDEKCDIQAADGLRRNPYIVFREIIFELGILYDILLASERETDI